MTSDKPTFYEAVKHIEHDNHESDLYLLYTQETRRIMQEYGKTGKPFQSQSDKEHRVFVDIPFAYEPWWTARQKQNK